MAVLAAVCAKVPEAKLGIIFLPMVTFSAGHVCDEQYVCVSALPAFRKVVLICRDITVKCNVNKTSLVIHT